MVRYSLRKAVGYNSTKLRNGALGIAPRFEGIASEDGSYDLQQITCNDEAEGAGFTILDAAGLDTGYINWTIWYDPMWTFTNYEKCWIDANTGMKVEGMTINPGQGLWISDKVDPEDPAHPDPTVDQIITFPGLSDL